MVPDVRTYADDRMAAREAAYETARLLDRATHLGGSCTLALSGGKTPRRLYGALATHHATASFWSLLHVFWGDERCVPPDDPDSNFAMAQQILLQRVPIPPSHIHRVPTELSPPEAATAYERELAKHFGVSAGPPRFDVVLLGVGSDGHTASLFPGDPVLEEKRRWVREVHAAAVSPPDRVTLTFPVLDAARAVLFLCTGAAKAAVVAAILSSPQDALARVPAARVRAPAIWFVDRPTHSGGRFDG